MSEPSSDTQEAMQVNEPQSKAATLEAVDAGRRRDQIANLPTAVLVANARNRMDDASAVAGASDLVFDERRLAAELKHRDYQAFLFELRDELLGRIGADEDERRRGQRLAAIFVGGGGAGVGSIASLDGWGKYLAGFVSWFDLQKNKGGLDAESVVAGEFVTARVRRLAPGAERDDLDPPGIERGQLRPTDGTAE